MGWLCFEVKNLNDARRKLLGLRAAGVDIDDLYIFGHGNTKLQMIGDESVKKCDKRWQGIGNKVKPDANIHLRGCNVGGNNQKYIKGVAKISGRNVTAFDDVVIIYRDDFWGPDYDSAGNLRLSP